MTGVSWFRVLLVAGLLTATALVILLGREVRSLRADARLRSERQQYMLTDLYVPRLELTALDGRRVVIGEPPAGQREVLFVYNTSCGFCRGTVPSWNHIAGEAARRGVAVYGLSLDGLDTTVRYSVDNELGFTTLLLHSDRAKALLRAQAVPQTLVVDSEGRVVLARPGVLTEAATDSVLTIAGGGDDAEG